MICWERVDELREEVGAEDFQEVVDLFLEEVAEVIERLRQRPDPKTYEADLHFLKGCALNLGFEAFCTLCTRGEKQAREGEANAIDLPAILLIYEQSRREFVNWQANSSNAA